MYKNIVIYYHPTLGENTIYFSSEQEAFDFVAIWANTCVMGIPLMGESLTLVFN